MKINIDLTRKTKYAPLKVGDRVRHHSDATTLERVTSVHPLAVLWSEGWNMSGYERNELRKLPAKRCHCPDCDRSKGKKPCPLIKP